MATALITFGICFWVACSPPGPERANDLLDLAVHLIGTKSEFEAVATAKRPGRVPLEVTTSQGSREPSMVVIDVGPPSGGAHRATLAGVLQLVLPSASGTAERRFVLGPITFFAAGEGTGFSYDLTNLTTLTESDLAALRNGRATVELTLALPSDAELDVAVPLLGAQLIPAPPP